MRCVDLADESGFRQVVGEVKRQYDLAEYIDASGVSLKPAGTYSQKGLCPFHNEKTPSFKVDSRTQSFKCFGCGVSGDLLSYVQSTENLSFMDALRKLAEDKGIDLSVLDKSSDSESSIDYQALRRCVRDASVFYWRNYKKLDSDHDAVREVTNRGLERYRDRIPYGYAPRGRAELYSFLKDKGYSDEIILAAGVCSKSERTGRINDFWSGRLMFFVQDAMGKNVGFSGRRLFEDDFKKGKYVNSPAGPLFHKSSVLYNHANARKALRGDNRTLYVAEGQFDVIAMDESGVEAVVAGLGTAFTKDQGGLCRRMVGEDGRIVFCFDGDKAGMNAAYKVFSSIPSIHSQSYVVVLPDGMDPCDYRMKYGSEALRDYVTSKSNQVPIVEHVLNIIAQEYDLEDPAASVRYVERAAPVLKTIASFALREQMIKKVSLDAFMSTSVVRSSVDKADPLTEDDVNEGAVAFVDDANTHDSDTNSTDSSSKSQPDTDVSSEEMQRSLVRLIKSDLLYQATARAFLLACRGLPVPSKDDESTGVDKSNQAGNRRDTFIRGHRGYPKEFRYLWEDFKKVSRKDVILPEDFRQRRVVEFIERSLVSKIAVLETTGQQEEGSEANTSQADELFNYLMGYIYEKKKRQEMDRFVGETTRAVANPDTPVEMVEKAIERIERKRENLGL